MPQAGIFLPLWGAKNQYLFLCCSSASPRSLRLREKAVGYFFGSSFDLRFAGSYEEVSAKLSPRLGRKGLVHGRSRLSRLPLFGHSFREACEAIIYILAPIFSGVDANEVYVVIIGSMNATDGSVHWLPTRGGVQHVHTDRHCNRPARLSGLAQSRWGSATRRWRQASKRRLRGFQGDGFVRSPQSFQRPWSQ